MHPAVCNVTGRSVAEVDNQKQSLCFLTDVVQIWAYGWQKQLFPYLSSSFWLWSIYRRSCSLETNKNAQCHAVRKYPDFCCCSSFLAHSRANNPANPAVCLDALDKLCAVTSLQYRLCDVPQLPTAQSQQDSGTSNSNPSSQYFLQYIGLLFPLVKLEKTCHERSYAAWGGTGLGCSLAKLGSSSASYLSTADYRHKERMVWRETCEPQRSEDWPGCSPLSETTPFLGSEVLAVFPGPSVHVCWLNRADLTRNV